jgi:probable HAF family extracellular repeat protein
VAGWIQSGSAYIRPFVFAGGTYTEIPILGGAFINFSPHFYGQAFGLNDAGQVVGFSTTNIIPGNPFVVHAFAYANGVTTDLFPGSPVDSYATGINNAGQIVGYGGFGPDAATRAFSITGATSVDLGTLGGNSSIAEGVNNSGQIVGYSALVGDVDSAAFIYGTSEGVMLDLNSLTDLTGTGFVRLETAYAISDNGYIVGEGVAADGHRSAFLLAPIPEPASYATLVALTGLGFATKRRRGVRGFVKSSETSVF